MKSLKMYSYIRLEEVKVVTPFLEDNLPIFIKTVSYSYPLIQQFYA